MPTASGSRISNVLARIQLVTRGWRDRRIKELRPVRGSQVPAQMAERAKSQKIRAADWAAEKKVQHWASATITGTRKTHWCQTEVNDNVWKVNRNTEVFGYVGSGGNTDEKFDKEFEVAEDAMARAKEAQKFAEITS